MPITPPLLEGFSDEEKRRLERTRLRALGELLELDNKKAATTEYSEEACDYLGFLRFLNQICLERAEHVVERVSRGELGWEEAWPAIEGFCDDIALEEIANHGFDRKNQRLSTFSDEDGNPLPVEELRLRLPKIRLQIQRDSPEWRQIRRRLLKLGNKRDRLFLVRPQTTDLAGRKQRGYPIDTVKFRQLYKQYCGSQAVLAEKSKRDLSTVQRAGAGWNMDPPTIDDLVQGLVNSGCPEDEAKSIRLTPAPH